MESKVCEICEKSFTPARFTVAKPNVTSEQFNEFYRLKTGRAFNLEELLKPAKSSD